MMTFRSTHRLVVGVDDSPEAVTAARFAVDEAAARQVDVQLVHTYQLPPANPPITARDRESFRRSGQAVLRRVAAQLTVPADMVVETVLRRSSPAAALAEAGESASLLVLGQHHITWGEQFLVGSMASRLAAHATCPVVFVPQGWGPPQHDRGPVVVALDGKTDSAAALQFAFEESETRGTRIVALHAVTGDPPATDLSGREVNLAEVLAGWKQDHPDITVDVVLVSGTPSPVIIEASRHASIVVVGRPHAERLGSWSRSVALAALKDTHCPLALVPQRQPSLRHSTGSGTFGPTLGSAQMATS